MAYQQKGPLKVEEQLFQEFQGLGIQVVGRLVQHQHIGRLGKKLGQQEPVFFSPGKDLYRGTAFFR